MNDNKDVKRAMDNFYKRGSETNQTPGVILDYTTPNSNKAPSLPKYDIGNYEKNITDQMSDIDLQIGFDTVQLPSKGIFYKNKISEIVVEYLTSKDEDILTTPALIENNTLIDVLLKAKIKTKGLEVDEMLGGDKNAVLIFLRASSYGKNYDVMVTDPLTNNTFKATIDLTKLKYKEITVQPDENLLFSVELPMRKKMVRFRLITDRELKNVLKQAETKKDATGQPYLELLSMRLKSSIVDIDGNKDRNYINRFVDAMPALDSLTLRRKIDEVTPDVDYKYEFVAPSGYAFEANVSLGVDFFFPKI
jgi:hypothetical protein